ncbi:MAG: ArsB/NhaD family transporter [Nitrospirae bacterium]|nr:ArsB/NhaD family transporter [Nitrospirota bacterium]MBF0590964.1 ArsB/NhaD family transporter [Nitrospirota bacterium]
MHETTQAATLGGFVFWGATLIFVVAYAAIISEKIDKTVVAILGAALMIIFHILDQHEAFAVEELGVDWNVVFLLISMMIIINIMRPTGVFEYIAIKSARLGKGEPLRIMIILSVVTALLSSLLDNVTTVLLIAPITILISDALEIDPVPFLIMEAIASNVGGTATLIGDPPNIMIASKARLDFMDFIIHLTPIVVVNMVALVFVIKIVFARRLQTTEENKQNLLQMNENDVITDPLMLKKSLFVLSVVLLGFVFHGALHYQTATIALFGAGLLLLLSKTHEPHHILADVEWSTIFFFIGIFILVGGVVKVGLIKLLSVEMLAITKGNLFATSMVILWLSAFASAIVDNIPYVATMNPLVINMAEQLWPNLHGVELLHNKDLMPIWWSLVLGACLGGNGSLIGASANVIVAGMAEQVGRKISFMRFMAYGFPIMILTVSISMIYVWLRYYV